jgi:glutamate-1-semialdehyde aminotransferase
VVWPYYGEVRPVEADDIAASAVSRYHGAYRGWLDEGLYLPPSAYEVCFLSAAHTTEDVERLAAGLRRARAGPSSSSTSAAPTVRILPPSDGISRSSSPIRG